jgi:Acyl-CoA dehydrogenases
MNSARIGTAIQGLAAAESSYQGALAYAKDRLAMRSLEGAKSQTCLRIQLSCIQQCVICY